MFAVAVGAAVLFLLKQREREKERPRGGSYEGGPVVNPRRAHETFNPFPRTGGNNRPVVSEPVPSPAPALQGPVGAIDSSNRRVTLPRPEGPRRVVRDIYGPVETPL